MKSLKLSYWGGQYLELQSSDDHFIIKDNKKFLSIIVTFSLLIYFIKSIKKLNQVNFDFSQEIYYSIVGIMSLIGLVAMIYQIINSENKISKKDIKEITQKKTWFGNGEEITIHYGDKKRKFVIRENDGHQVWQFFRENRN